MDEAEVVRLIGALPGVVVVTAGPEIGAPEVAWGDSFAFYDPDDAGEVSPPFPFVTVVTKDYPGFDTESRLDRPGVFRLNLPRGREQLHRALRVPARGSGRPPRASSSSTHRTALVPHPVDGRQGWVSIVAPGAATDREVRELVAHAHERARLRYERRGGGAPDGQTRPDDAAE